MADPRRTVETLLTTRNAMRPGLAAGAQDLRTFAAQGTRAIEGMASKVLNLRNLLAGGLIGAYINKITAEGDAIGDQSARLSVTAREYQVLAHAMALTGGSAGELLPAFRQMANILFDAGEEGKRARQSLAQLGVTLADLRGGSPYEQFQRLAQALGRVEDANARAALAQEVFGRSAQTLLPLIRETGGNLDALAQRMERGGLFFSDAQIAAADQFRDSLADLNKAISVAAFEALGQTIEALTGRIRELIESGRLKEWGADAAATVTALANAVGATADFIVRHRAAVVGLGVAYAGLKVVTTAITVFGALQGILTSLAVKHAAAAVAANAHAAAEARVTATASAAAIAKWTDTVGKISPAMAAAALRTDTLAGSVRAVGGALNAVAAAGAVAFIGWNVGKAIGEVTGLHEALANSLAGFWVDETQTDEAKRNAALLAAGKGLRGPKIKAPPKTTRVRTGAVAAPDAAAQQAEQWESLRRTVEGVWQAARVGLQTGDEAAVSLWQRIAGTREVQGQLAASDIARIGARLQEVMRDDADAAVRVLKAATDREIEAIADSAERQKAAREAAADAMGRLQEMDVEDLRAAAVGKIEAAQRAAEAEAQAMGRYAARLERSADETRQRAQDAWDRLVAGDEALPTAGERRAKRARDRREDRLERRAREVIARLRAGEGDRVTAEGKAIARAWLDKERAEARDREARDARQAEARAARRADRLGRGAQDLQAEFARADRARQRAGLQGQVAGAPALAPRPAPSAPAYATGWQAGGVPQVPSGPGRGQAAGGELGALVQIVGGHTQILQAIRYAAENGGIG